MAKKVPFPFVQALPDRAAFELERNFQYLADQFVSTVAGWDAIVDPTLTADDTVNLQFKTVFAAVKYLADTKGITDQTIGLRNTNTTTSEVGNYAGTTSGLTVRVLGIGSTAVTGATPGVVSPTVPTWDFAGFHENSKFQRLIMAGLRVAKKEGTVVANATWFNNANISLYASGCFFDGQGASSTTVTCNMPGGNFLNCSFIDVAFTNTVNCIGCYIGYNRPTGTVAQTGATLYLGCTLSLAGGNSCTLSLQSTTYVLIDSVDATTPTSSPVLTLAITVAKQVSLKSHASEGSGRHWLVNITSPNLLSVEIEGWFDELTVPAPVAASAAAPHRIHGVVKNRFDITGPANVALAAHDGTAPTTYVGRIRGSGVNGSVTAWVSDSAAAATVLDFIAAKRCVISASVVLVGAASTGAKTYNFDATSANNILILETDALGAASADAGANDLVITDATFGSSPTTATIDADFSHDFMMGTL